MNKLIQSFTIALFLLSPVYSSAEVGVNLTLSGGVVRTGGMLGEIEAVVPVSDHINLTSAVGMFGHYPYVDGGFQIHYKRLTIGVSGAYFYQFPVDKMASHGQFKNSISWRFFDRLSLEYTHFSNGSGFVNTKNTPNSGRDFGGLVGSF